MTGRYVPVHTDRGRLQGLSAALSEEARRWLTAAGSPKAFDRGEHLLRQGETRSHVVVLLVGYVKIMRTEVSGAELMLSARGPGEVLGDMAAVESGFRQRSATAIALNRCQARVLSLADFEFAIDEYGMHKALARHLADRYREGEQIRAENSLPALQRISALLCRLASDFGHPVRGDLTIDIGLSQEDLRRAVWLSPSTFAAGIKVLRGEGLLTTARGRLVIHEVDALRRIADHGPVRQ